MFTTKQDLLSLKKGNFKLKENFKKFLEKQESNKKKVKEFMEEQMTLIDNLNQQFDGIIAKDKNQCKQPAAAGTLTKKRKSSKILNIASKKPCFEPKIVKNSFENVIKNPGLQHLAEIIFSYLNYNDIKSCQCINRSSKSILANPKFWLQKLVQLGMSKQNQNDWIKAIKLTKDTDFERNLQLYLKRSLCKRTMIDIPCFIDENTMQKSCELINKCGSLEYIIKERKKEYIIKKYRDDYCLQFEDFTPGCFQALSALQDIYMDSFMILLAERNNLSMMKVVSPLLSNPNNTATVFPGTRWEWNNTPFVVAACYGNLEIIKFFVSILNNVTVDLLQKAIDQAELFDEYHVVRYLNSILASKQ